MPLGVAVSGGADSVALLYVLLEARRDLVVLHVNHGLRGSESDEDQCFVSELARQLRLPCLVEYAPPAAGNLEQSARNARYSWFRQLVKDGVVERVATGHTRDDQAETVLFRFLRGAGTAGLAGILPETADAVFRPVLQRGRAELRRYLLSRGIAWREDSSNDLLRFSRNRIRHELLPELERSWNLNLTTALAQTAEWARAEEEYWRDELLRLVKNWLDFGSSAVTIPVSELNALPLAAARRAIRWAVERAAQSKLDLDFANVERVLALARTPGKMGSFRKKAWEASRSCGLLRIAAPCERPRNYQEKVVAPGRYSLPDRQSALRLELIGPESVYNNDKELANWPLISGSLELRNWQPGDRFYLAGHETPRKLKVFFQEAGIPSWERSGWPVLTCENSIVWTRRLGVSAQFAPPPGTAVLLRITESPNQKL